MRVSFAPLAAWVLGIAGILLIAQSFVAASLITPVPVPEIDATSLSAGIGLLAAGVLIVRSRRRR